MSRRLRTVLIAVGALIVVVSTALEAFIPDPHLSDPSWTHHWYQVPGWNGVMGFFGCVLIVVVSKALGKAGLQKPEDFYGEERGDE